MMMVMSRRKGLRPASKGGKVLIATLHPGQVTTGYAQSLATLCLENPGGAILGVQTVRTARSWLGRNQAIETFLASPAQWLLWVDSDMTFTPQTFATLWQEATTNPEAKIVTALAFMYDGNRAQIFPNIFHWNAEERKYEATWKYPWGERFWCDATGVAFTLIHREVFESMAYPWHQDWHDHPDTATGHMGHDVSFFHEARKKGYRVRYCADARTGHIKPWEVTEESFKQQLAFLGLAPAAGLEESADV